LARTKFFGPFFHTQRKTTGSHFNECEDRLNTVEKKNTFCSLPTFSISLFLSLSLASFPSLSVSFFGHARKIAKSFAEVYLRALKTGSITGKQRPVFVVKGYFIVIGFINVELM
jgi:hypothetical protein